MTLFVAVWLTTLLGSLGVLYFKMRKLSNAGGSGNLLGRYKEEIEKRKKLKDQYEGIYSQMIEATAVREKGLELIAVREALKSERGRVTITQAELETVEVRLRELEEIERELEASAIDSKEEIKILEKKQAELAEQNAKLKEQIAKSSSQFNQIIEKFEMSSERQAQIQAMQTELIQTQEKTDLMLLQVEECNHQYLMMKKRYDALDIEYAQLYEKFSSSETQKE